MHELPRLSSLALLGDASPADLAASARHWSVVQYAAGETFALRGGAAAMMVVTAGELEVVHGHTVLGHIGPGEPVGEGEAFLGDLPWVTTVRATAPTELCLLPRTDLRALRSPGSTVYSALLTGSLRALARRLRAADARLTSLADGDEEPAHRAAPTALDRLWSLLSPPPPPTPHPAIEPVLRALPDLRTAGPGIVSLVARELTPRAYAAGEVVVLEGDDDRTLGLVAEGVFDVSRRLRNGLARTVAHLGPGAMLGAPALVTPGTRSASVTASRPGWVFELGAQAWRELPAYAREPLDHALLRSLVHQVHSAYAAVWRATTAAESAGEPIPPFVALPDSGSVLQALAQHPHGAAGRLLFRAADLPRRGVVGDDEPRMARGA